MTTVPTPIVDKNGKRTTVYRRLLGRFGRSRELPAVVAKKEIQERSFDVESGVLTKSQVKLLRHDPTAIRSLCDHFNWEMMAIGPVPKNIKVREKSGGGPQSWNINCQNWYGFAAVTPDGAIVDTTGIYASVESFRASLPLDAVPRASFQKVERNLVPRKSMDYDHIDPSIAIEKIGYAALSGDHRDALTTVDDIPSISLGKEQARRSQEDVELGREPSGFDVPIATKRFLVACPLCQTFYRDSDANSASVGMECPGCGKYNEPHTLIVGVLPEDVELLTSDDAVRQRTWYHVSTREDWMGEIDKAEVTPVVHLGSKKAAYERTNQLEFKNLRIYEVKLNDDIPISPVIEIDDTDRQPITVDQLEPHPNMVDGANRYINSFEDCGSVSLMVNPTMFTVIDSKSIRYDLATMRLAETVRGE